MGRFLHQHGLSLAMLGMFAVFLVGQFAAGWLEYNDEREQEDQPPVDALAYLRSAHFAEATAENWESEFLQMSVYVLATAFLYQKGSAESKDPRKPHSHHATKPVTKDSPWPARRGGWVLRLYEHSLSLAFLLLFLAAFAWHTSGGRAHYNEERITNSEPPVALGE